MDDVLDPKKIMKICLSNVIVSKLTEMILGMCDNKQLDKIPFLKNTLNKYDAIKKYVIALLMNIAVFIKKHIIISTLTNIKICGIPLLYCAVPFIAIIFIYAIITLIKIIKSTKKKKQLKSEIISELNESCESENIVESENIDE
jgi:hypothetical protein